MLKTEPKATLAELLPGAWQTRVTNFGSTILYSAPSAKRYDTPYHQNDGHTFPTASATGRKCSLGCDHCRGKILTSMTETKDAEDLRRLGEAVLAEGGEGLLLSGGSDPRGEVPLQHLAPAIADLAARGLRILVHTGLVSKETARMLKESGVAQVLVDLLGDRETIRQVYHLEREPEDYLETLLTLKAEGLTIAPHIVVGLHYGEVRGEYRALAMAEEAKADMLVLVVLNPLPGTPMAGLQPVSATEVARLGATARLRNPQLPISLGCARPPGPEKQVLERLLVRAGVTAIAYPMATTVEYGRRLGLQERFHDQCCTL